LFYQEPKLTSFTSFPGDKKENGTTHITDLSSLSKTNPLLAASAAILFFSNAGVPPLAGFYGKFNVILDAVAASMYLVALAAVICSVLGTFYSIRLVKIIYFHRMNLRQNKRV
jgi:NADH-quinone oxidoreductase subunit N